MGRHSKERPKPLSRDTTRHAVRRAGWAVFTAVVGCLAREGLDQALSCEDGPLSHHDRGAEDR
ncbi:hypothetical protein [Streptomyces mobaraensis]|uniref:Uncharacterized protein n=1 Tax=Streptomyces mobaraensis TaxID=35621 RepID=A0A5N5W1N9_STRMB|nr:hypothetical protein [Streptomyces mobaraensis]KAB7835582.1 hypothetical protein FRZ00_27260 [Streptomyces mobaraensis]